jgi:hypothetical protein
MSARKPIGLLSLAALAILAACLPAAAWAGGGVAGHEPEQSPADVRGYWTPERMLEAEALEPPAASPEAADRWADTAITSAISPDVDTDPAADTLFPQRIHGKLFLTIGTTNAACSATVVKSFRANLILTAGHCVFDSSPTSPGRVWATNVAFVPGYRNGSAPFGVIPAIELRAPQSWIREEGDIAFDLGAVNLAPGAGGEIQNWLGARGITFNRPDKKYKNNVFAIYGYPGQPPPYDGQSQIICNSQFVGFEAFSGSVGAAPCHQQQGSSGGGWVRKGKVNSVVSHGGCVIPSAACELTVGTYFGDTAYKLWDAAAGTVPKGKRKQLKKCKTVAKSKKQACKSKAQTYGPVGA